MIEDTIQSTVNLQNTFQHLDSSSVEENWFLYWKTASSLWREKIQLINSSIVIVPLNWSLHFDENGQYDFGRKKPETHLKQIVDIGLEFHKRVIFFLPLAPTPFLPNGGIPYSHIRHMNLLPNTLPSVCLDAEGNIHKLYSFFDTTVFKSFQQLCFHFSQYLSKYKLGTSVYGLDYGYLEGHHFCSYFNDCSFAFEQAFERFLRKSKDTHPLVEKKKIFIQGMFELYAQTAQDLLKSFWSGIRRSVLLGGHPRDFFTRLDQHQQQREYTQALFYCLQKNYLPSSILLSNEEKQGNLVSQINDLPSNFYYKSVLHLELYEEENTEGLPLVFFDIYNNSHQSYWNEFKILNSLEESFKSLYRFREKSEFIPNEEYGHEVISFIEGRDVDQTHFRKIIKVFMAGGSFVINKDGLSSEIAKKLEVFFLGNSLTVERVHYQTLLEHVSCGRGKMLLFDGQKLKNSSDKKLKSFWSKLFSLFNFKHLMIDNLKDIDVFWQIKSCSSQELSYKEIRRLHLYNSSGHKTKTIIEIPVDSLVLLRFVDDARVHINRHLSIIELEFLPEGHLSMDFGVCSDE